MCGDGRNRRAADFEMHCPRLRVYRISSFRLLDRVRMDVIAAIELPGKRMTDLLDVVETRRAISFVEGTTLIFPFSTFDENSYSTTSVKVRKLRTKFRGVDRQWQCVSIPHLQGWGNCIDLPVGTANSARRGPTCFVSCARSTQGCTACIGMAGQDFGLAFGGARSLRRGHCGALHAHGENDMPRLNARCLRSLLGCVVRIVRARLGRVDARRVGTTDRIDRGDTRTHRDLPF